jgi:DNA end-binding protein Ku
VPAKVKPEEIKLAKQVIGNFEAQLDLKEYRDEYQEELQRIIDAKIAGEEVVATDRGGAAEGRQPDGRAAPEPRPREHRQEEDRQGGTSASGQTGESRTTETSRPVDGIECRRPPALPGLRGELLEDLLADELRRGPLRRSGS